MASQASICVQFLSSYLVGVVGKAECSSSGIWYGCSSPARKVRCDLRIPTPEKVSPELNPACSQAPDTQRASLSGNSETLRDRAVLRKKSETSRGEFPTKPAPFLHRRRCAP